jgi:hypothetical protein
MDASSVPLPRRHHRRAAEPVPDATAPLADLRHTSDVDEDVMRRILFGLNRPGEGSPQ